MSGVGNGAGRSPGVADEVDFLELIQQGVEAWNRWRVAHPETLPDLSRAYLFKAELSGINFSGMNLSRACLIGARLNAANLCGANLREVYANEAVLASADLADADLQQGNLSAAILTNTNLSRVRAEGTNFSNAELTGACIEDWQIDSSTDVSDLCCEYLYQKHPAEARYPESGSFDPQTLTKLLASYAAPAPTTDPGAVDQPPLSPLPAAGIPEPSVPGPQPLRPKLSFGRWRWLGVFGIGGLLIAIAIGKRPAWVGGPLTSPASSPALAPAVDLGSLPCNELPPPDLQGEDPSQVYSSGIAYYGQFRDGAPADGRGIMVFANGDRYDGEFFDGQRHGCGTFTFANGRRYMGQFVADQFQGIGIWELETGERYVGQFQNNKCAGWGTFILQDGSSKSGTWQEGTLVGDTLSCNRGVSSEPEETVP